MVEDIITTGLSSRETLESARRTSGNDRRRRLSHRPVGGKAEISVRRVALATLDIPAYPADALPPELAAIPAVKPGSRALEERKFAFPI
jgi:orotate phosphoribosyltransferase